MRIALYQPDIAGNVGTILRLAACFGVPCDIIEPCGFPFSDRALRRAGGDLALGSSAGPPVAVGHHKSFENTPLRRIHGCGRLNLVLRLEFSTRYRGKPKISS